MIGFTYLHILFSGQSMNPDGMMIACEWEGETPVFYFFKAGLIAEKVVSVRMFSKSADKDSYGCHFNQFTHSMIHHVFFFFKDK